MTSLKQRRKIRGTYIYTKGKTRGTHKYTKREYQTDTYILRGRSDGHIKILRGKFSRTHTYIYHHIEQIYTKTNGADQMDTNIY